MGPSRTVKSRLTKRLLPLISLTAPSKEPQSTTTTHSFGAPQPRLRLSNPSSLLSETTAGRRKRLMLPTRIPESLFLECATKTTVEPREVAVTSSKDAQVLLLS